MLHAVPCILLHYKKTRPVLRHCCIIESNTNHFEPALLYCTCAYVGLSMQMFILLVHIKLRMGCHCMFNNKRCNLSRVFVTCSQNPHDLSLWLREACGTNKSQQTWRLKCTAGWRLTISTTVLFVTLTPMNHIPSPQLNLKILHPSSTFPMFTFLRSSYHLYGEGRKLILYCCCALDNWQKWQTLTHHMPYPVVCWCSYSPDAVHSLVWLHFKLLLHLTRADQAVSPGQLKLTL